MFDIDYIRKYDQNFFDTYCAKRHLDSKQILALKELDEQVRNLKTSIQNKNALVNKLSSQFTALVKANDQVKLAALKAQVQQIKSEIAKDEQTYNNLSTQLTDGLMRLPNVPAEEVPLGLAIFSDVGVSLLAILNSLLIMKIFKKSTKKQEVIIDE